MRKLANVGFCLTLVACQGYDFVYQPDTDRMGVHLRFAVQQPSKADILFVVDNSKSMTEEQTTLSESLDYLLHVLAPLDTSYRIGIVSTDVHGYGKDDGCPPPGFPVGGNLLNAEPLPGARGNCDRPEVILNRPHDGARGRLIAAYDPNEFDLAGHPEKHPQIVTAEQVAAFNGARPSGPTGARWVIDRDMIQKDACVAANCVVCAKGDACFDSIALPVAAELVKAYFRSNIAALGRYGNGWEAGLQAGLLAVGIDPAPIGDPAATEADFARAVNPPNALTNVGKPNAYVDSQGVEGSWLRDNALLAIMWVSDEQDCSILQGAYDIRYSYEEAVNRPEGSVCYRSDLPTLFFDTSRMSRLLSTKKTSSARVAVGFIGGVDQSGPVEKPDRRGTAADCVSTTRAPLAADRQPSNECSCLQGEDYPPSHPQAGDPDDRWCDFTKDTTAQSVGTFRCDGMAGDRYVDFLNRFPRRTFDSICRGDDAGGVCTTTGQEPTTGKYCFVDVECAPTETCTPVTGFGVALTRFANLATLACFDLDTSVAPANGSADYLYVRRSPRADADAGLDPVLLPRTSADSLDAGWWYDDVENKVCLTGLDRLIGDVYDIFVLTRDVLDRSK